MGPLVAVVSFVCSIGNVPLAAVLWNGGISFGGVLSFIFADLIILPILDIYRRYYGIRMAAFLLGTFYMAMVAAGPVYRLLGAKDLGVTEVPPLDKPVTIGSLGFHYHSGGHTAVPADWKAFLEFAERHFQGGAK